MVIGRIVARRSAGLLLGLLTACFSGAEPSEGLPDGDLLVRASLDLRGIRPAATELAEVRSGKRSVAAMIDHFLEDPSFAARVRAIYAPVYRTQMEYLPGLFGLEGEEVFELALEAGEEPLRLLSHVATADLPWTEIVTADYSFANERTATLMPSDYPTDASGWRVIRYTDNRPAAGVLATNAMWWRYPSDGTNFNRGRAAAIARILLCQDYHDRPVDFPPDLDLTDSAKVASAVRTNESCVNCHVSLDAMGSYLFGFSYAAETLNEMQAYHPERELAWRTATGREPAFFGAPGRSLQDLGAQIAADPRFVECAVQQVYSHFAKVDPEFDHAPVLSQLRETFIASGLRFKALVRAMLESPAYRGDGRAAAETKKLMAPDVYANQMAQLTGFSLTTDGLDLLSSSSFGLRSLAGGADFEAGTPEAVRYSPTIALVIQRIAEGAAFQVVDADMERLDGGDPGEVLDRLSSSDDTGTVAVETQVASLLRRYHGEGLGAAGNEPAYAALFAEVLSLTGEPAEAWQAVLTAIFRDPAMTLY